MYISQLDQALKQSRFEPCRLRDVFNQKHHILLISMVYQLLTVKILNGSLKKLLHSYPK